MPVVFTPTFLRMLRALPADLREEAIEKIDLFKIAGNHKILKVHKLSGRLSGRYSFSVNFQTRIVFQFIVADGKRIACLLTIGDHDVYR